MDTRVIRTHRLDLVWLSPEVHEALLDGRIEEAQEQIGTTIPEWWPAPAAPLLRLRLEQMRLDPASGPWLLRAIVLRHHEERAMIGHAGFHGPPDEDGTVEIGYSIFPGWRGLGFATEAADAILERASHIPGVHRFRASIGPGNGPSLKIARNLGFELVGSQWDDEEGEELVFERVADGWMT